MDCAHVAITVDVRAVCRQTTKFCRHCLSSMPPHFYCQTPHQQCAVATLAPFLSCDSPYLRCLVACFHGAQKLTVAPQLISVANCTSPAISHSLNASPHYEQEWCTLWQISKYKTGWQISQMAGRRKQS